KVKGLPNQRLSFHRKRQELIAIAPTGCRRFDLDGNLVGEHAEICAAHGSYAIAPDGDCIATWKDDSSRIVFLTDTIQNKTIQLSCDQGNIDAVVFAADGHVLVRYHKMKRVAVFDPLRGGAQTHRIQARELGSPGSAVEELFPLANN